MSKGKIDTLVQGWKKYIGIIIIIFTLLVFYFYVRNNPTALASLGDIDPAIVPLLLLLYLLFLFTNFFITTLTIRMCGRIYPAKDSLQLTTYSTLVNFFGPLQSGPGFRAVFLKTKLGIKIRDYTLVTMTYYFFFALISLLMMFGPTYPKVALLIASVLLWLGYRYISRAQLRQKKRFILGILLATCIQLFMVTLIYFIELKAVGANPEVSSAIIYTGSANLALFVAFTPGAIGIREAFIYFSQSLHHISTENILSASLLDRSIYIVFLFLIFILSSSLHFRDKFMVRQSRPKV